MRRRPDIAFRNLGNALRGWLGYHGLFGRLNPPVIIVGSQNSGTTVLASTLALHPQVENRSELRVLWDPRFHERDNDTLKTAEDAAPADIRRLRGNFAYYQWKSGKPLVINKHPENCLRIHFIKKIFPESKLIHIVRDGRATVASNLKRANPERGLMHLPFAGYSRPPGWRDWLSRPLIEQFAYMWNTLALCASREGKKYGEDYLEVRYEDLTADPVAMIGRLWRWIGLDADPALFARLPKFESMNFKWRSKLTAEQLAAVNRIAREGLEYFGYIEAD